LKANLSCFDLGCVGFLTNAMLYNREGIRCGFIWVVPGLTIARDQKLPFVIAELTKAYLKSDMLLIFSKPQFCHSPGGAWL